jgi:2-polyprenyl-3-methyl-5-hydroxy-6-metoxy-1,4-benzoquinol methylase
MAKLMAEAKIKKKDWEDWLSHWSKLQHPIVPGDESISRYKQLIAKYFKTTKGKKALQLGATWQTRDMLAELGFEVTAVDISETILQFHTKMCKAKLRKEKLIVDDWLKFTPENNEKFDLVIGDAANFQFREESYPKFFSQVASWLKPDGFSIQLIEGNHKDTFVPLTEAVKFIKNATPAQLDDYKMKAYYYLGTSAWKNMDTFGNVGSIEHDIKPFIESGEISAEKFDRFSIHVNNFSAALLPRKRIDAYITKQLDIVDRIPFGGSFVEEAFYWLYVMKVKA